MTFLGSPFIRGTIRLGEFEEVKRDLGGHFGKPLKLNLAPDSHPLEVMRIGLWLREQRPALQLGTSCIGACAWFVLDSGRTLEIAPDTVIAFNVYAELWARLRQQLDRGDVGIDDERSRDSTARFIASVPTTIWDRAAEFRETRLTQSRAPMWIQEFVEGVTALSIEQLVHGDDGHIKMVMRGSSQNCLWWIPDREGLRQLGLEPGRYVPADAARAAKMLGVPASALYIGPALREPPAAPLCAPSSANDPGGLALPLPRL